MPLYVYMCECNHKFDKMLSISNRKQPESEPCPKCNENKVKQAITGVGSVLFEPSMYKPRGEFRELLQQIKKNNHGSTMDV